jgi:hypothetical protein
LIRGVFKKNNRGVVTQFFNLILGGLKCKIKILGIYFDEKCDLSACAKIKDYNVFLSFYFYLQDNLYLQDNDSHSLLNLILIKFKIKKKMSLIGTLFSTYDEILAL